MIGGMVRRWVDGPDDLVSWVVGKLPRSAWPFVEQHEDYCVALGPGGLFALHPVSEAPPTPDDRIRSIHSAARALSDRLLVATHDRVWPHSVGVLPVDAGHGESSEFGIAFLPGDHLLRWLLTRPEVLDAPTRSAWARCLAGDDAAVGTG
jgi:hypothetical protein